ncbi:MAG TPA: aldo/keto reductase [Candidatus Acidoferrales bacterium]|nr:aldo/keto reductase [Candidatus Acidoferrales bacterium]
MQYVNLGSAGVKVSRICFGCMSFGNDNAWKLELDEARPLVQKAIDLGINFFDTANSYSLGRSEEITGECLKGYRDDIVVATKVRGAMGKGPNDSGLSRYHVMRQIKTSLERLQMNEIDLYQIHRWDYMTPIEETMRTLNDIVRQGMARYIGASSMFAWQLQSALYTSEKLGLEKFVSMQNHYNLVYREEEREVIPLCKEAGIAVIPWSPLARGFLTGKYKRGETPKSLRYENERMDGHNLMADRYFRPEDFDVIETVVAVAKEKDVSPSQVALAWLLHKDVTAPIIGVTKIHHVEEAVEALDVKLDSDDMKRLEDSYKPHPVIGHE